MEPSYHISKTLHFLIFLQFLLLKTVLADSEPNYFYTICDKNGNYTENSIYQNNLQQVLSNLGTQTSFSNSSHGETPDKAYGMFYCRADIDPALCQSCVKAAKKQIVNVNCTNQKEGVIWYQECTLRYANRPLNSLYEVDPPTSQAFSRSTVSNPIQFQQVVTKTMNNLVQKAAKNNTYNGYATEETAVVSLPPTNTLYSLVQCTPDIFGLQCEKCLLGLLKYIKVNAPNSTMVMFFRSNCQMRYDSVPFYTKLSSLPSPSSEQHLQSKDIQKMDQNRGGKGILFYTIISVVPAVGLILLLLCIIVFCVYRRRKKQSTPTAAAVGKGHLKDGNHNGEDSEIQHSNSSESLQYNLETIKSATGNFSIDNKLGEGGFGPVYKGTLPDGQEMAVKRLSEYSGQGLREFTNEVELLAKLQHRNLVNLLGFCVEGEEKLLIYEFVSNLSLDKFLFDPNRRKYLDWETRFKIIIGIARGLLYLHEDSRIKIIHRDMKISNILLDEKMNPKIADFGTARLMKIDHTQANTSKVCGTFGYMAPEYAAVGVFSTKSDVYSFGLMLLEIISGQNNNLFRSEGNGSLISHGWKLWNTRTTMELVDPSLGNNFSEIEVLRCIQVGLFCVQVDPSSRPGMESVLFILQNNSSDIQFPSPSSGEQTTVQQDGFQSQESDQGYSRNSTAQFTDMYPR